MLLLFPSIPLRNLFRRPLRTTLTLLGIVFAVGSMVALIGISGGIEKAWTKGLSQRGIHVIGISKNSVEIINSMVDESVVAAIKKVPGVYDAAGELIDIIQIKQSLVGVSGMAPGSFLWKSLNLIEGRLPEADDQIVAGERLCRLAQYKVGDKVSLYERQFVICGISQQALVLNEANIALPLPALQQATNKAGKLTMVNIRLDADTAGDKSRVMGSLRERAPDLAFYETTSITDASQVIKMLRRITVSTTLIAITISIFFFINTLFMSVSERRKEFGILAAIGWSKARILKVIIMEGVFMAVLGSMGGLMMGIYSIRLISRIQYFQGFIDTETDPVFFAQIIICSIAIGALASLLPAWRSIRADVIESLKYE
ncbi:FtsX-like permease family protein [bacterium]|nr:MAG: FtsX-like permease family protein [bacterium]